MAKLASPTATAASRRRSASASTSPSRKAPTPRRASAPSVAPKDAASRSASSIAAQPRTTACLCGCGQIPQSRKGKFMPGHDNRLNPATPGVRFNGRRYAKDLVAAK